MRKERQIERWKEQERERQRERERDSITTPTMSVNPLLTDRFLVYKCIVSTKKFPIYAACMLK